MPRNPNCELCPLHEAAHTVCVWGQWRGDPEWRGPVVVVVGQSPGKREDWEGLPFVGRSGAEIEEALRQAGVGRYYITNAAKCSPEVNGVEIDRSHWAACADYLEEEISQIRPGFILALGNPAVQRLLGRGRVSEVAGKEIWSSTYEAWVVSAWHPAAILRNQGRKPSWLADILRFGRLVRGELVPPPSTPPVSVDMVASASGLEALSRLLVTEPAFTYDFEANVPDPNIPGWYHKDFVPYALSFAFDGSRAFAVPLRHSDVDDPRWWPFVLGWLKNVARKILSDRRITTIAWNDTYDGMVFYRLTGLLNQVRHDAMMSAHLLDENAPKSLKWNGRARLGWPDWDINARWHHPIRKLCNYNGYDTCATFLLWEQDRQRLLDEGLHNYFHSVDMPKLWFSQRVMAAGIYVDRSYLARGMWGARKRLHDADARLADLSEGIVKNPRSAAQVARWLYEVRGLPVLKKGKKHGSTDEETINKLARTYPEAKDILACRRPNKEITTYYHPISRIQRVSFDRRYHADIRTTSVETGRKGSGFHTTPRPEESLARGEMPVRPIFTADTGQSLVVGDYRQLEARLAAWTAAGKPTRLEDARPGTMLWDFLCNIDVYRKFASQPLVLNKAMDSISKDERQRMGKVPVLALLYTISPKGLQEYAWKYYEIDWTLTQATRIHTAFHRLYPEFPYWHHLEEAKLRRRGYAISAIGRVRHLPGAAAGIPDDIRAGINAPIQSVASDITQEAGYILSEAAERNRLPYIFVGDVHDSILSQGPEGKASDLAEFLYTGMRLAPEKLRPLGLHIVPGLIDVEISIGPWGAGKEWKYASARDSGQLQSV